MRVDSIACAASWQSCGRARCKQSCTCIPLQLISFDSTAPNIDTNSAHYQAEVARSNPSPQNVTIAVLGGSVSAGSSSRVRPDQSGLFHRKLQRWLQSRFNGRVEHINAAMPAVPPGYMEQCLSLHVPPTVDLVLLEASANMCGRAARKDRAPASSSASEPADPCEAGRESVERMLRQVLLYPTAPAVVFVHAFPYWTMETPKSWYARYPERGRGRKPIPSAPLSREADLAFEFHRQWGHGANEDMLEQLAKYYDAPSISLRNVIWHAMKANASFGGLRLPQLYYDRIHPSNYGHSMLAHGLVHLMKRALLMLEMAGAPEHAAHEEPPRGRLGTGGAAAANPTAYGLASRRGASLQALQLCRRLDGISSVPPLPMLPNVAGAERRRLECHDADSLRALVEPEGCRGWAYVVERSPSGIPKPGWMANEPGAVCTFAYPLDASSSATNRVGVGFLKSYERMGQVRVECVHECHCDGIVVDAHTHEHISPLDLIYYTASVPTASSTSGRRCGVRLTVLNTTSSRQHKFKLTALFLNKYGGSSYFGRWIYGQASEARGAVAVAEEAETRSKRRAGGGGGRRGGRGRRRGERQAGR